MANWSQSHFLQSLGWATLNSFWQMALLWCLFLGANQVFRFSASKKYQLSIAAILTGFAWFLFSFFSFYQNRSSSGLAFFNETISGTDNFFNICLIAASVAYLSLLVFPCYRLFRNWQFVKRIQHEGLKKADLGYRLFVQRVSGQLGIAKKVKVYVSSIVKSPVTVGYLKPIILLPIAALNHLSPAQVEAVLLHELSHIRRYDYLLNFVVSIIHTVLYFNPFVKLFLNTIERERENCCDELVLQFGYDKVGYASALLTLEKISSHAQSLALAATGKHYLLNRIEKIVGMEKKKRFQMRELAGILAALICIIAFNSILIVKDKKNIDVAFDYSNMGNPFALFNGDNSSEDQSITPLPFEKQHLAAARVNQGQLAVQPTRTQIEIYLPGRSTEAIADETPAQEPPSQFVQVGADDVDLSLTKDQKEQVAATVKDAKKVMTDLQWKDIEENQIAEVLTTKEKAIAQLKNKREIEKINWQNLEQGLKARYDMVDWNQIQGNLAMARRQMQIDSLQSSYNAMLVELEKAENELSKAKSKTATCPLPDVSVTELAKAREEVKAKVEAVRALKQKKVVRL